MWFPGVNIFRYKMYVCVHRNFCFKNHNGYRNNNETLLESMFIETPFIWPRSLGSLATNLTAHQCY